MIKAVFAFNFPEDGINLLKKIGTDAVFVNSSKLKSLPFKELKSAGIKIFCEIGLFVGEDIWQKHRDCQPIDKNGNKMEKSIGMLAFARIIQKFARKNSN